MLVRSAGQPGDNARIGDLIAAATVAGGREVLSEHKVLQLAAGAGSGLIAEDHSGDVVAYVHLTPGLDGTREIETVVDPRFVDSLDWPSLIAATREAAAPDRGHHWAHLARHIAVLEGAGLSPDRTLLQLRRPLPPEPMPALPGAVRVRTFVPGDEEAFLAVHVAAFAGHPEVGLWDRGWLDDRFATPWFDRHGFLLAVDGEQIAAYCWTKVHERGVGEIFLIGVAPGHRRRGLGVAISLAGLWHLTAAGCSEAMLFADGSNRAGLAMYDDLGFRKAREDRCYFLA